MSTIGFWSQSADGRSASIMSATACHLALKGNYDGDSLILSRTGIGPLEAGLISERAAGCDEICGSMGLNALFRARMSHQLSDSDFHSAAIGIYRYRLEFICGRDNVEDHYPWQLAQYGGDRGAMAEITRSAGKVYSQVFTDYSGLMEIDEFLTETCCDSRVIVLGQSPQEVRFLKESVIWPAPVDATFVISGYERTSRYSLHNLERLWPGLRKHTVIFPHDVEFEDAAASGEIPDFIGSRLDGKSGSETLIESLEGLGERILPDRTGRK